MDTTTFLKEVLSSSGLYCIFASNSSKDKRSQQFYGSIDQLVSAAKDLDDNDYDVYFALATFNEGKSRKVDNVKHLKSFFLDLDCGPSKEFASQQEAMQALKQFCKTYSLPRPTIINSGRGVHVYWPLKEAVCLDDWLPVAERLKALCARSNFPADPAVTSDAARVLRVPQTHNYKPDTPVAVGFIGPTVSALVDFDKFSDLVGGDLIPVPNKRIEAPSATMLAALGNQEYKFKHILQKSNEGAGCVQIYNALKNQNGVSEPIWRGMLSILKACSDGSREKAHKLSSGYEGYNPEETDAKWDNLTADKRYTCNKFEEENPEACLACPNRGKLRSPLHVGKTLREATEEDNVVHVPALDLPNAPVNTYVIPKYPFPYVRGASGGVYVRNKNADGDIEEKQIYHNDVYVVQRIVDVEIGEAVVMRLHLPKDGVREFTVPLTAVTSKEEFRKQMSMRGVAIPNIDDLMRYVTVWINELQATEMADKAHRQFGWTDDTASTFILGNQKIRKDTIEFNPPSAQTAGMFPAFEPKGTLEEWKALMEFYNRPGFELHQYIVCAGFGSILMEFMGGIACSAIHLHSKDSGLGKTTAMKAAASIWGDPEELILDDRDTHNSKMNRSEVLHNLPLFIDELTNATPKQLSELAYQFTSGKQRGRMVSGSNAERIRGESWSLMAVTSGNTSVIERIRLAKENPSAEAQRILEVRVDKIFKSPDSKAETDVFAANIEKCYGHAGPIYVQHIINNLDQVKQLIGSVQPKVDKEGGLTSENRFWSAGPSLALSGGILAKNLGLIQFDMAAIHRWIIKVLKDNKDKSKDMAVSIEQTLNEYINEHYDNILRIKSTSDLRKQDGTVLDSLIQPETVPRNKLVARYETDIKKLYLVPKPFRMWCGEQQINYSAFVQEMMDKLKAKKMKMRLGKGTHFRMPPTDVLVVQFAEEADESGSSENV